MDTGDDIIFKNAININLFQWITEFYLKWSGRLIINFLEIIIINQELIVWKFLNALIFSNLVYGMSKLVDTKKHQYLIDLLIMTMLFAIPYRTFSNASLWVTGSFNYLWPVSFAMPVLNIIKKQFYEYSISKLEYVFSCVSSFVACYNEQVALILITLVITLIIYKVYKNRGFDSWFFSFCLCVVLNSAILFLAPGNYLRSSSEMIQWNASFNMLSFFDKIWLGIFSTMNYLIKYTWYILIIVPLFSFITNIRNRRVNIVSLFSFLYLFIYLLITKIIEFYPYNEYVNSIYGIIYSIEYYNSIGFNNIDNWVGIILSLIFIVFQIYIMLKIYEKNIDKTWIFLIMGAALCSSVVMGFTPTIYASGSRIFFVMTVLIVYAIIYTVSRYENMFVKMLLLVFVCYFSCKYMNLYLLDASYLFLF